MNWYFKNKVKLAQECNLLYELATIQSHTQSNIKLQVFFFNRDNVTFKRSVALCNHMQMNIIQNSRFLFMLHGQDYVHH